MEERIQIVDENDMPLGYATREEAWEKKLRHRFVRIIVFNQDGKVLLQKRSKSRKKYPDMWTDAATGHVDYGETYVTAAPRELMEEVGISVELEFLGKFYTEDSSNGKMSRAFHGVFKGIVPNSVKLNIEEDAVSEVKWVDTVELKSMIAKEPNKFTPGLKQVVERYL